MKYKSPAFSVMLILSLFINLLVSPLASAIPALAATLPVIDDFENGLTTGTDTNGVGIGFITFQDPTVKGRIGATP